MTISAGDLLKLRSIPHQTKLYLVIQQPEWRAAGAWTGYVWSGTVSAAPGTTNDEISVNSANGLTLLDGMTVLIDSTETGGRDRGVFKVHGDQTIGVGAETLYISNSGELAAVQNGDKIVALDEFRYWPRYPKVTEAASVLTWYKDWGYFRDSLAADGHLWSQLGGTAAARREAAVPPTPIMGPHRVAFIDPAVGSVDVDFDWSDSYTLSPGATVNAWASAGEDGGAGWSSALENPAAQTYSNLSGLAGYRTTLSVLSDVQDPIVEFRRGVRYVFTLRRPDQYQDGVDPTPRAHYVPIVDFEVSTIAGDFSGGSWSTSIRIFGSTASEYEVQPGALVILFAEDWYAGTKESLGPITGAENIVFVGHIADGTVTQDSETGDVTFDIVSVAEQASRRENYPVPVTNNDTATEWTDLPDLTISTASWWFVAWHSNLAQVTDVFSDIQLNGASDTREIAGQDFLAGDLFRASLDNFLQARVVGRVLTDRYDRVSFVIDRQVQTAGGATTLFDLQSGDWVGQTQIREINEFPANQVEAGGVNYNAGTITPYLSIAPGNVAGYIGTNQSQNNLAVSGQAQLNQISGDLYGYANNRYPELILQMAGDWRFGDIWPQEYIDVDLTFERVTFTNTDFLVRGVSFDYDAAQGAMFTTYRCEFETDGEDGVTVPILADLVTETGNTETPPEKPPGFNGRAMIATDEGIWYTANFLDDSPSWTTLNSGDMVAPINVYTLVEDPNNPGEWWAGTDDGIYYNSDLFGSGTWDQLLSLADINAIATVNSNYCASIDFCALVSGYVVACGENVGGDIWVIDNKGNGASDNTADWRGRGIGGSSLGTGGQTMRCSYHTDVGGTNPRTVVIGTEASGFLFIEDTQDTSGAWTAYAMGGDQDVQMLTVWENLSYDDDDGVFARVDANGTGMIRKTVTFLDAGVPAISSVGDASMVYQQENTGVIFWADIENVYWFTTDDSYVWYSIDGGTTWTTYGNTVPFTGVPARFVGCADGNLTDGFVLGSATSGVLGIEVYYNNDNGAWQDKTGDLDAESGAVYSWRIYLLDV